VRWQWTNSDAGLRIIVVEGIDLTLESQDNEMTLANGSKLSADDSLVTLRWRI